MGGWLLIEVSDLMLEAFEAPPWVLQGLLILFLAGIPVAIILAWVFDITPEHRVVRTSSLEQESEAEEEAVEAPAMALEMGSSERRQLTLLHAQFELGSADDPEEDPESLREALAGLQAVFADLADRYEAHILPGAAEELTLAFGYPKAREDDARRAVAAGLALINEARALGESEGAVEPAGLAVRAGVATSLVVVEESARGDVTIIGQAPRMASWLISLAGPETLFIGPYTRKLVAGHFELEVATEQPNTPFGENVTIYRVETAVTLDGSLARAQMLTGRDDEMHLLQSRWEDVVEGGGQFVILQGEPGIGKSSLLSAFVQHVHEDSDVALVPAACSPHERNNPLAPVKHVLQRSIFGFTGQEDAADCLAIMEVFLQRRGADVEVAMPLLAGLLGLDTGGAWPSPGGSAQIIRAQTLELLLDLMSEVAARRSLLFVIEDIHWSDPSTLEMLQMMVERGAPPGLFVLMTARPSFAEEWVKRSNVFVLELLPLARKSARALIEAAAGEEELPESLVNRIIEETDGNPLFIQELTMAVLESDAWRQSVDKGSQADLARLEIPATLKDSLASRVDKLGESKGLLQLCSVLGQEFSYELLLEVSGSENEAALKHGLSELVSAELLYQRGVLRNLTYQFKHILILETAYGSLLKSKRKELHERTADILEQGSEKLQDSALLAYHFTEAGNAEKAVAWWTLAGKQSLTAFANQEAIAQARNGIKAIEGLSDPVERLTKELPLQSILGMALLSTYGYVDQRVREAFTRAHDLCEQIGDAPQLFQVVVGLWMYYIIAGELDEAFEQSQRLLRIAEATGDKAQHLQSRYCQALVLYYRGEFLSATSHLETAIDGEDEHCDYAGQSASGDDTRIHVRVLLSMVNWHLGRPKKSLQLINEASQVAKSAGHPWGEVFAAFYGAWLHQVRGEPQITLKFAQQAMQIAEKNGFRFWFPLVGFMLAWASSHEPGDPETPTGKEGVAKMKEMLGHYRGIGAAAGVTYLQFRLAGAYAGIGEKAQAVEELETGWAARKANGEDFYEPDYFRIRARISLAEGNGEEADDLFRQALASARRIESKALELRVANDFAARLGNTNRVSEAENLLGAILQRFSETDDSIDFMRARDLLKRLKKGDIATL